MSFENPVYSNADQTIIVADKLSGGAKVVEASQSDLWNEFLSGAYGTIGPFVPEVEDPAIALEIERSSMIVSAFQAKAALSLSGSYDAAQAAVEAVALAEGPGSLILLAWNTAIEYRRKSPSIALLQAALSLTDAEVDDLFRLAATIDA